jgi:ankyrin repeat protein
LIVEAAFSADPKTLQLLLDAGADVNRKRKDGATALLAATYKQNWEFSRALIQKGADVNARMEVGTSLLFAAASGDLETVKLLVQKGADVNAKDNHAISPLSIAQTRNHQAVVDFLKTAGAKP